MNAAHYMALALAEAELAFGKDEIPVGAVIVKGDVVLAKAHNANRASKNPLKHAETMAIEQACTQLGNERLLGCDLYVTKEPCAMCAGAIVHARIRRVIIATRDRKYGACGTVLSVCGNPALNHRPIIEFGLLEQEAKNLLQCFFRNKRA